MKRLSVIFLAAALILISMTACGVKISLNASTENTENTEIIANTENTETTESRQSAETAAASVGELSDYVATMIENEVTFDDGNTGTLRLPKILIDSEDAKAVNSEINKKLAAETDGKSGVYKLDYTAALNDNLLSVCISVNYDGGSTGAEVYNFDVSTGKRVGNDAICKYKDVGYTDVIEAIEDELEDYYTEHNYYRLPMNDDMKAKTFSARNLKEARLYLNEKGKIMCAADVYAAVGGGHFVINTELDL